MYKDLKIKKETPKKKNPLVRGAIIAVILLLLVGGGIVLADKGKGLFDPISIVSTVTNANLKETDGRTNMLLLGSDKRTISTVEGGNLTDSILLVSIGRVENDVVMISLPRDLWVEDPRGAKTKINEVYINNQAADYDSVSGGEAIMDVVEDVLGVPIHYYGVVNFALFKNVIDILGGIEVHIDRAFVDHYYPVEGKENAPDNERYERVEFQEGLQTMNGEMALKYARSRKGNNGEDTDFARSERQQKVIAAIKNKALSLQTIVNPIKMKELYELYSTEIDTNITFSDIQSFYILSQQIDFNKIISIVLDDRSAANEGGLLYNPSNNELYGGAYVLVPKTGDFSQLHAYVQRYLFANH